jgi:serine/threonine protein kinase
LKSAVYTGAIRGACSNAGVQVVSNLLRDRPKTQNLFEAAIKGGIQGAVKEAIITKSKFEPKPNIKVKDIEKSETIKTGPFNEEIKILKLNKKEYYIKDLNYLDKNKRESTIENYKRSAFINTGPQVQIIENNIVTNAHILLEEAIIDGHITKIDAKKQLQELDNELKKNRCQHTDVKPSNIVLNKYEKKVQYIDSGEMTAFGDKRKVGTIYSRSKNANITELKNGEIVNENTDRLGLETTFRRIDMLKVNTHKVTSENIPPPMFYYQPIKASKSRISPIYIKESPTHMFYNKPLEVRNSRILKTLI